MRVNGQITELKTLSFVRYDKNLILKLMFRDDESLIKQNSSYKIIVLIEKKTRIFKE